MKPDLSKPTISALKKTDRAKNIAKPKTSTIATSANIDAATADIKTSASTCTSRKYTTATIPRKKTIQAPSTLTPANLSAYTNSSMNSLHSETGSNASGVLSDNARPHTTPLIDTHAMSATSDSEPEPIAASHVFKSRRPGPPQHTHMAKINLSSPEGLTNLPETVREVFLASDEPPDGTTKINLARINPIRVAREIERICGAVERVDHKRSGSLLIVTKSHEQVRQLLKTTVFCENIPVVPSVAWGRQTVYGKIYAPEFSSESLEEVLECVRPCGVVGVRKFYQDPARASSPLYVLTFLKDSCPETLKVGYSIYHVDPYYPAPLRCGNCLRWGHSAKFCHGAAVCSNCGQKGHTRSDCMKEAPTCLNCKGDHDAASKSCPFYIREQQICRLKVDQGISFKEARDQVSQDMSAQAADADQRYSVAATEPSAPPVSTPTYSPSHPLAPFPTLTQLMNRDYASQPIEESQPASSIPTRHTSYANALSQPQPEYQLSQDSQGHSSWITAGQRPYQRAYPERRHSKTQQTIQLLSAQPSSALPATPHTAALLGSTDHCKVQLSPQLPPRAAAHQPSISAPTSTPHYAPTTSPADSSILQVLRKLLPVIMRLLLCSSMTEKVECFVELGMILAAETIVGDTLQKLGLSSISPSI